MSVPIFLEFPSGGAPPRWGRIPRSHPPSSGTPFPTLLDLRGKKALVAGIAHNRSIAWAAAHPGQTHQLMAVQNFFEPGPGLEMLRKFPE